MAVKLFKINSPARRALLIAALFACFFSFFLVIRWYFGDSIATQAAYKEVAEFAVRLSPDDPQSHYALALLEEKTFSPESLSKSLAEYQTAAALAPNDFRLWFALGAARERGGDAAGAELALKKSLELAPNYATVQWALGNVLLRKGKTQEAFAEISKAAENNSKFTLPAIMTAWQVFDGDLRRIKQSLGDSSQINFTLAEFLASRNRFDDALEIWNALPAEEKKTVYKETGSRLLYQMLAAKKYRDALQIENQISDAEEMSAIGKILNGGFENDVKSKNASFFEWRIEDALQPQIGFDDREKHGGNRSLVIIFNSADGKDFRQISQNAAVESGKTYRFQAFYKSDLKTPATLRWEIVDLSDGKVLATTDPVVSKIDWTSVNAEFTTSETTEAVAIRLARENCKSGICPIYGKIWFDDFSISQ